MKIDERMSLGTLIFVYNVDATAVALLRDLYQGITTGSTDCHLCDITFGKLFKDPTWAAFVDELPLPVEFRMRSTFRRMYPEVEAEDFPAAFILQPGHAPRELIPAAELNAAGDLDALRDLVKKHVAVLLPAVGDSD